MKERVAQTANAASDTAAPSAAEKARACGVSAGSSPAALTNFMNNNEE